MSDIETLPANDPSDARPPVLEPAASSAAKSDPCGVFVDQLKFELAEALRARQGQPALTLTYTDTAAAGGKAKKVLRSTSVHVENVNRQPRTGALTGVTLRWTPAGFSTVFLPMTISVLSKASKGEEDDGGPSPTQLIFVRLRLGPEGQETLSDWAVLEFKDGDVSLPSEDGTLPLPVPRNTPQYGLYLDRWFARRNADQKGGGFMGPVAERMPRRAEGAGARGLSLPTGIPADRTWPSSAASATELAQHLAPVLLARLIEFVMLACFRGEVAMRFAGSPGVLPNAQAAEALGLPDASSYRTRRAVDLSPFELQAQLEGKDADLKMYFPWHVYDAICTSLNLGRNLILTGPPGCGKTDLAIAVSKVAARAGASQGDPKVVTASPAWTAGDVIGRYFPQRDGKGLQFLPGVFLQAVVDDRWLIIDELNRADLDQCFGELFTVLAGQSVDLPFLAAVESDASATDGDDSQEKLAPVRIVRAGRSSDDVGVRAVWTVGDNFRLIGTMNDADRASLHQLSFALLRRFDVIQIDAPEPRVLTDDLLVPHIDRALRELNEGRRYSFTTSKKLTPNKVASLHRSAMIDLLGTLFCTGLAGPISAPYKGLIAERVVGVSTLLDMIRFASEGLRPPAMGDGASDLEVSVIGPEREGKGSESDLNNVLESFVPSVIALGVVLMVLPQLDVLGADNDRLRRAVEHVMGCFNQRWFVRMERAPQQEGKAPGLQLQCVGHRHTGIEDRDGQEPVSIQEFLRSELLRKYRGTTAESWIRDELLPLVKRA